MPPHPAEDPAADASAPTADTPIRPTLGQPFAALAGANLAAQAAEQLSLAAVPMVAVLALGAGTAQIGWLNTAQTLPFLLLSIPLGLWADRHSRRGLMVAAEALRALSLAGLAGLAWAAWSAPGQSGAAGTGVLASDAAPLASGPALLGMLAVLGFVGACGTVGFNVAAPALVPALVPRPLLGLANGRLELARSAAFAAGPALAGALVAWAGASAAFALALVLSLVAVGLLIRLREPPRPPAPPRHPWAELSEGARQVWQHPLLRPVLLTAIVWNLSWFVLQAAYVPHAVKVLGLNAQGVGFTLAAYGVGMVVGALAAPRVMAGWRFGRVVTVGPLFSVAAAGTLVMSLYWPQPWLAALGMFLFGAGPILWTISSVTLRQTVTPTAMLGRVSAIFLTVNAGARPLGAAIGAVVGGWAASFDAPGSGGHGAEVACLWLAWLGFGVQAWVIGRSAAARLERLPAPEGP